MGLIITNRIDILIKVHDLQKYFLVDVDLMSLPTVCLFVCFQFILSELVRISSY